MLFKLIRDIYIVKGFPALYLSRYDALIIADMHLGFEEAMAIKGIYVPQMQFKEIAEKVSNIISMIKPSWIIINGDIKHEFTKLLKQERNEISALISLLRSKNVKHITVVRGNHDTFVSPLLFRLSVGYVDTLVLDDIVITHGHIDMDPKKLGGELIIIGHEHPAIVLRDELDIAHKFPCVAVGKLKTGHEIVIMPHLSIYASGNVLTLDRESYLSPIVKKYCLIEELVPYIVDENLGLLELPKLGTLASMGYF